MTVLTPRSWNTILRNWRHTQSMRTRMRRRRNESPAEALESRTLLSAGTLDPSFGDGGLVTTDIGWPTTNRAEDAVGYQSDGKFIVATNARDQLIAVRYDSSGVLDPSFGDDGVARVSFAGRAGTNSLAIDGSDNIILAGYVNEGGTTGSDFVVARLSPDGTLDTSFAVDGISTIDFGGTSEFATAVTIDGAGRIVVGGYTNNTSGIGSDLAVARLNADGSPDLTFDVDGQQTVDFATLAETLFALETDHSNRVVLVGRTTQLHSGGGNDIAIVRLSETGQLDQGFSSDGLIRWDLGSNDAGYGVAIYGTGVDERIVVTGTTNGNGGSDRVVIRLDGSGEFDTSFDGDGVQFVSVRGNDYGASVAIDANQQILVAGHTSFPGRSYDWVVTRLTTSGAVDATFGVGGSQAIDFGGWESSPYLTIDSSEQILVAGWLRQGTDDIGLARLNSNGSPDLSFGTDGKVQTDIRGEGTYDEGRDIVAYQPDGKMIVVGTMGQYNKDVGVLRYNVDGSLDQTFGQNGISRFNVGDSDYPQSVAIDSQGRIVIGGYAWFRYTQNTRDDFSIVRLTPNGDLDTTFNGTGMWSMDFGTNVDRAYAVAVDSSDRIYLAGSAGLVRVTTSGGLDPAWGNGGVQPTALGNVRGMAFDSAGRILLAGTTWTTATNSDFAVKRLTPTGETDTTYGDGGMKLVDLDGTNNTLTDLAIDDQDRAVMVGIVGGLASIQDFGVARLTSTGQIDTSFNSTGYQRVDFSGARDLAYAVAIDSNGRVVVSGTTDSQSETSYDFGVVRFNSDGSLDNSFDSDGRQTIDFGNTYDVGSAVMVDASDRVIVLGDSEQGGIRGRDIAIARLLSNEAPTADDGVLNVAENTPVGTSLGVVSATDPDGDSLTYSILLGNDAGAFAINADTGEITVADSTKLDFENPLLPNTFTFEVLVDDGNGGTDTATVTVNVLNQASITGSVFVDANQNSLYDGNEMGIDGVLIELLDAGGTVVESTVTSDGGFYLFEDLDPGTYQIRETQPTGVDDGAEIVGEILGVKTGTIEADDVIELTLARDDASDYDFAELGQEVGSGDTATIGFWQNKHGQSLITQGGTALAQWLSSEFANVFGNTFSSGDGAAVAAFYKDQLFKQKGKKSVAGPAKVDAQFMAVALATFFTSRNLAGDVAASFGLNVTDTGIGTKIVNVGSSGAAFGVADHTTLTILQLLTATDSLTDIPNTQAGFSQIYNGHTESIEQALREMANLIYSAINEQGAI